ncbi:hypothetical protein ASG67_06930 [Sphingomonas sp. Leaf339]|uniref:hypothetical protein n=1 Tax=Sphingomonas sp. Leaf339 TaxID=1736343 RepID=UPI0006F48725|nr:hypothetical protein [Sphingomonas sp. Leaf339]KQU55840.1 hypothetical protein ASG67_06930 [Sphingomonas sp. Leaf339]
MPDNIQNRARRMYEERRRRRAIFPPALLSDHAWDILLWTFIENADGRDVKAAEASAAAMVSVEVGIRWIAALGQAGLLVSGPTSIDPLSPVLLSEDGVRNIRTYLEGVA